MSRQFNYGKNVSAELTSVEHDVPQATSNTQQQTVFSTIFNVEDSFNIQ